MRAAGLRLCTLAEVFGIPADETIEDVEWLELAGARGWPVLMKDARIRYRTAERDALLAYRVRAFCLISGNVRAAEMAELFVGVIDDIALACREPGPFLFTISRAGLAKSILVSSRWDEPVHPESGKIMQVVVAWPSSLPSAEVIRASAVALRRPKLRTVPSQRMAPVSTVTARTKFTLISRLV